MRNRSFWLILSVLFAVFGSYGQDTSVKRTFTKTELRDLAPGGSVSILGAPVGSIKVKSWSVPRVEVTAVIEIEAKSEADVAQIAEVTTFVINESLGRLTILTVGTHDKSVVKKLGKRFPKHLVGLPFKVNYEVSVPIHSDVEINSGIGDVSVSGNDGFLSLNALETDATVDISGRASIIVAKGSVKARLGPRNWRLRPVDISVADGDLTLFVVFGVGADIDAKVLRSGSISMAGVDLKPRDARLPFTERLMLARLGVGGPPIALSVGNGKLSIAPPID